MEDEYMENDPFNMIVGIIAMILLGYIIVFMMDIDI